MTKPKVANLTELQKKEFDDIDILMNSNDRVDRLKALFMINITCRDNFSEIVNISTPVFKQLPKIAQKMRMSNMGAEAEIVDLAAALFDVMSIHGVMADRVSTEQNRKAQRKRHEKRESEIVPFMDEVIKEFGQPVSADRAVDRFMDIHPYTDASFTSLKKLYRRRCEVLGVPRLPRGRPSSIS